MDQHPTCVTCGAEFPEAAEPPPSCPICDDERQDVGHDGQRWTTLGDLRHDHRNAVRPLESRLTGIATVREFTIGQCADPLSDSVHLHSVPAVRWHHPVSRFHINV